MTKETNGHSESEPTTNSHVQTIAEHERIIAEHEQTIAEHEQTIAEHEAAIAEQRQRINEQVELLDQQANSIKVRERLYVERGVMIDNLLTLLTRIIEMRDPYTKGHSDRVADLTLRLASDARFAFEPAYKRILSRAALVHDIGKAGISDSVLHKPTLLTDAEYVMMQQHTTLGHKLIASLELGEIIESVVLSHHEAFDGSGYPHGLEGEQIPFEARIVHIADFYDALTSDRPYRLAYNPKEALEIMQSLNEKFDPNLLDAFLNLMAGEGDK